MTISGGSIGFRADAESGSEVNITGGNVGEQFEAKSGSVVNISGGHVGASFEAESGSEVNITGGVFADNFSATGSDVELIGGVFFLNGVAYTDPTITLSTSPFVRDDVFAGTLADGSTFIFAQDSADSLSGVTLTTVALPAPAASPITVTTDISGGPSGLRPGHTLTLQNGGVLGKNYAVVNATLNVEGGVVGEGLETAGSVVNISGGTVGNSAQAFKGSIVNISGGAVGNDFHAEVGSEVNISGGHVGEDFYAEAGSVVNITGGSFGDGFRAFEGNFVPDAEVNISGGSIGDFWAFSNNLVRLNLIGGEFFVNGVAYTDTDFALQDDDVFTGTLADGSTFIINYFTSSPSRRHGSFDLTLSSLPTLDTTPVFVTTDISAAPSGLRLGQTMTLQAGGVLGRNFAVVDATLNIEDGVVGFSLEAADSVVNISGGAVGDEMEAYSGSVVNISGGSVGDNVLANSGSEINISGGSVGNNIFAYTGSEVNITGGSVGTDFRAFNGSVINISGGNVGNDFEAESGSEVNISGGTVGDGFRASFTSIVNVSGGTMGSFATNAPTNITGGHFGGEFYAGNIVDISGGSFGANVIIDQAGQANLFGTEFFLDGVLLDELIEDELFMVEERDVTLSGRLADGSAFSFDLNSSRVVGQDYFLRVSVTRVIPEPSSLMFLMLGGLSLVRRRMRP